MKHYDVVIVGAGSGGLGAAITAARLGLSVLLLEHGPQLGGTAVRAGVSTWEMGVGGTGVPFDIYQRLASLPGAVGIYSIGRHFCWQDGWYWPHALEKVNFPGGENLIDPTKGYQDTLRRHPGAGQETNEVFCRAHWHGVTFEPAAYVRVVTAMLAETGRCTVRLATSFTQVEASAGMVRALALPDGTRVTAGAFIDGTGDGVLCRAAGCMAWQGSDPFDRFQEAGAPPEAASRVNGVSLLYRITPAKREAVEPLPAELPAACWWTAHFPPVCANQLPNGDYVLNMLPTMEGEEFLRLGYHAALAECRRRVAAHWHFLQEQFPEFRRFRLQGIAEMLGVRESYRIATEYVLTAHDIRQGISRQTAPDIIALADHACDRHGAGGGCAEVAEPYGIPYRCLLPRGFRNLLVACRAAGFSSIAASSCRLSRTMLQLGQAAGTAVALATASGLSLPEVSPEQLRASLRAQHVQLTWPEVRS